MNKRDCIFYDEMQDMSATVPRCKYYDTWGMSCEGCSKYFFEKMGIDIIKSYVDNFMTANNLRRSM